MYHCFNNNNVSNRETKYTSLTRQCYTHRFIKAHPPPDVLLQQRRHHCAPLAVQGTWRAVRRTMVLKKALWTLLRPGWMIHCQLWINEGVFWGGKKRKKNKSTFTTLFHIYAIPPVQWQNRLKSPITLNRMRHLKLIIDWKCIENRWMLNSEFTLYFIITGFIIENHWVLFFIAQLRTSDSILFYELLCLLLYKTGTSPNSVIV